MTILGFQRLNNCSNCAHFEYEQYTPVDDDPTLMLGFCRKHAPSLARNGQAAQQWPRVWNTDFCGEHLSSQTVRLKEGEMEMTPEEILVFWKKNMAVADEPEPTGTMSPNPDPNGPGE